MLELLITLAVGGFIGYHIGVSVIAWRLRDIIYKEAKAKGITTKQDQELFESSEQPTVFKLCVEKSQDTLYLFDYEKDAFVCQAKTIDELAKLALEYKNIKYAAVVMQDGSDSFAFVNGVVKTKV